MNVEKKKQKGILDYIFQFADEYKSAYIKSVIYIAQCGTHAELMKQDGIYHRFVDSRRQAIGWKI